MEGNTCEKFNDRNNGQTFLSMIFFCATAAAVVIEIFNKRVLLHWALTIGQKNENEKLTMVRFVGILATSSKDWHLLQNNLNLFYKNKSSQKD